jgi:hypothetical protein
MLAIVVAIFLISFLADWLIPKLEDEHQDIASLLYFASIPFRKFMELGIVRQTKFSLGYPINDQISRREKCYICGREFSQLEMHANCQYCGAGLCFSHLALVHERGCPNCKSKFGD